MNQYSLDTRVPWIPEFLLIYYRNKGLRTWGIVHMRPPLQLLRV